MKNNTIVYKINNKVYINLTNECSNNCEFCVRNGRETFYDYYLWLDKEPDVDEVIEAIKKDYLDYEEFVFCGFGEPLYKLVNVIKISKFLKSQGKRTRLNTNGQADIICKKENVAKSIKGLIDIVSISLNATSAEKYQMICHCAFGEEGYYSMLRFAESCKNEGIRVKLSIVDCIGEEEIEKAKEIAKKLGVELRIREYVE